MRFSIFFHFIPIWIPIHKVRMPSYFMNGRVEAHQHRTMVVYAFVFILFANYGLLFFTFRSIFLRLKAILMNVLSVAAAYGILVWVIQEGHLQTDSFIDRFVSLLFFCTLFGLSMDYEVFLLSRMPEAWLCTGNNAQAVAIGLQKTGGVITSAA